MMNADRVWPIYSTSGYILYISGSQPGVQGSHSVFCLSTGGTSEDSWDNRLIGQMYMRGTSGVLQADQNVLGDTVTKKG